MAFLLLNLGVTAFHTPVQSSAVEAYPVLPSLALVASVKVADSVRTALPILALALLATFEHAPDLPVESLVRLTSSHRRADNIPPVDPAAADVAAYTALGTWSEHPRDLEATVGLPVVVSYSPLLGFRLLPRVFLLGLVQPTSHLSGVRAIVSSAA